MWTFRTTSSRTCMTYSWYWDCVMSVCSCRGIILGGRGRYYWWINSDRELGRYQPSISAAITSIPWGSPVYAKYSPRMHTYAYFAWTRTRSPAKEYNGYPPYSWRIRHLLTSHWRRVSWGI
jgi:hypothetical protein